MPYTTKLWMTSELKKPDFLKLNRNGMAPVIEDPNTNLVLFEASAHTAGSIPALWLTNSQQSGAIIDYVLEQYDTEKRLTFALLRDRFHMKQWLQYQNTAQGPVLQRIRYWTAGENKPAVRATYVTEFRRVCKVLDDELAQKQWLVGDRLSAADLAFFPFHSRLGVIMGDAEPDVEKEYPHLDAWYKRMTERAAVKKTLGDMAAALQEMIRSINAQKGK